MLFFTCTGDGASTKNRGMTDAAIKDLFDIVDQNKDGKISIAEAIARGFKEDRVKTLFAKYDADNDGQLNLQEAIALVRGENLSL
ncbi:neuronal calcium sensor 1-like [Photinus pyralis]|uniref:neuronal calcium sensor 1-like n=1 Tax=Photinus pyralis TaxID=7054 RepID=UPI001266F43D|nr:neuronal calcium sensor 1-like [Photinus pyralis]